MNILIGQTVEIQGSRAKLYTVKNVDGKTWFCDCMSWKMQNRPIDHRTCKHIIALQGVEIERSRVGDDGMPTKFRNGSGTAAATGGARSGPSGRSVGSSSSSAAAASPSPALLLANKWTADVDPEGYWLSEKLDGLRAYWDGTQFLSRNGNEFKAPGWFCRFLPRHPLDGELYVGRQQFERTMSIIRRHDGGEQWKDVRYLVFDAPKAEGVFTERLKFLEEWFDKANPPHALVHPHEVCRGVDHLREELDRVVGLGGEGLMLRKPDSLYEGCRSSTLLKVKSFQDADAVVTDHVPGKGRHKGRLGSLQVRTEDGIIFNIGTGLTDHQREDPPPIGSIITFTFSSETTKAGIPKCASFLRVRPDE